MNRTRLSNEEISSLCGSLSHLISAGISPADGLALIYAEEQDPWLKAVYRNMFEILDGGASLCDAIKYSSAFPDYVCSILEVADKLGRYEKTLKSLSQFYANRANTAQRLKASLTYPLILLAILFIVILVLLVWVLPVFDTVYAQLGSGLSGVAAWFLSIGRALKTALPYLVGTVAVLAVVLCIKPARKGVINLVAKAFGDVGALKNINSARYLEAYTMAVSSGMTPEESAELARVVSSKQNERFKKRCEAVKNALENGESAPKSLANHGFITKSDATVLEIGQKSGKVEQAYNAVSAKISEQSEFALEKLLGRIEPLIVAISCVIIGSVLLSVMLPLINVMNSIG